MSTLQLLSPVDHPIIGPIKSRVVMSAMTRGFATVDHLCTSEIAAYYERRARGGVGLILTEGIIIHPSADGYNTVTHLHTVDQMTAWRAAVNAVHQHGTKIYAQLWHCGRISHADYTGGFDVVSSTAKPAAGMNRQNQKLYGVPRALRAEEMPQVYEMFCKSASLALDAGFDGVQLHMGHGYLVDQFLDAQVNDREDSYGGAVANRCRFAIELLAAVIAEVGASKIMVRISPSRMMGGLYEWPDMEEMLDYLLPKFNELGLRQLDISCANADYFKTSGKVIRRFRPLWPHMLVGGASLSLESAESEIEEGWLDLVTWGRAILANPDFVERAVAGQPLRVFDDSMRANLV